MSEMFGFRQFEVFLTSKLYAIPITIVDLQYMSFHIEVHLIPCDFRYEDIIRRFIHLSISEYFDKWIGFRATDHMLISKLELASTAVIPPTPCLNYRVSMLLLASTVSGIVVISRPESLLLAEKLIGAQHLPTSCT